MSRSYRVNDIHFGVKMTHKNRVAFLVLICATKLVVDARMAEWLRRCFCKPKPFSITSEIQN